MAEVSVSYMSLRYSYVLRNTKDLASFFHVSSNGGWSPIDSSNHFITDSLPSGSIGDYQIIDNFFELKQTGHDISIVGTNGVASSALISVNLESRSNSQLIESQLNVLRSYKTYGVKTILLDLQKFQQLFQSDRSSHIKANINEISMFCNVEVMISSRVQNFTIEDLSGVSQSANHGNWYVYIVGESDDIVSAEVKLRVLLDNESGLFIDCLNLPLSLVPLVGGLNFGNFKSIAKETGVNLYLPNVTPGLFQPFENENPSDSLIYLSGLESQVQLSIKELLDVRNDPNFEVFYKSVEILKFKKDQIILSKLRELNSIIYKYGVFIQLPALGSDASTIHFQGSSSELIELAVTDFLQLTSEIVLTEVQVVTESHPAISEMEISRLQYQLSQFSKNTNLSVTVVVEKNLFQLIGYKSDTLNTIKMLRSRLLPFYVNEILTVKDSNLLIKTDIELNLTHHEFISGKKNGKIVKILNSSNGSSKIQFNPLNDYVFKVELLSSNFDDFIVSFGNLENEFPSEFKFFIPESFHRQIIGTGGSLIQSIMRKYNVFVKFSNQIDMSSIIQKRNLVRFDNVIIRCPSKNASNIALVQQELNSLLLNNNENGILNAFVKISRNQYRLFKYDKIQEIEKKHQSFIKFPTFEFNEPFQIVEILGPEKKSITAAKSLIDELPNTYEFKISLASKFGQVFNESNEEFLDKVKIPLRLLYRYEILGVDHVKSQGGSRATPYHSILLNYLPEGEIYLEDVCAHLTHFLREHEFMILDRAETSNNDLLINGSAANTQAMKQQQGQHVFQFKQQSAYSTPQLLNKFNSNNLNNGYQAEYKKLNNVNSMFHNPHQQVLTPSNNIYNFGNAKDPQGQSRKGPNSNNGFDIHHRQQINKHYNFQRPF